MALKLEDLPVKPKGALKSLLDIILENKEKKKGLQKKRVLRPWESFEDLSKERNFEDRPKKKSIMKPFVKEIQLTDEQKMALKIKKRAAELFSDSKF